MALSSPQLNQITVLSRVVKTLADLDSDIELMDVLFNGSTNWASLVTAEAVAEIPSFVDAGLTHSNILDAIYLVKMARAAWRANLVAFAALQSI